jgi:hypothetical protein
LAIFHQKTILQHPKPSLDNQGLVGVAKIKKDFLFTNIILFLLCALFFKKLRLKIVVRS